MPSIRPPNRAELLRSTRQIPLSRLTRERRIHLENDMTTPHLRPLSVAGEAAGHLFGYPASDAVNERRTFEGGPHERTALKLNVSSVRRPR